MEDDYIYFSSVLVLISFIIFYIYGYINNQPIASPHSSSSSSISSSSLSLNANENANNVNINEPSSKIESSNDILLKLSSKIGLNNSSIRTITLSIDWNNITNTLQWPELNQSNNNNIDKLTEICNNLNTFVLINVKNKNEYKLCLQYLKDNNIFQFISSHRMLCYENDIGKLALLRQLNPDLHIEHDEEFIEVSTKFFKKIIHSTFLDNISLNKNVRHQ